MVIYETALGVIWLAFILVWAVSAFKTKRTINRPFLRLWWVRLLGIFVILAIIRFDVASGRGASDLAGLVHNPALNIVGVALAACGVGLAIWARVYLGRNWGMPMSVKENPELVVTGPYALLRNPIYT